ncbi:Gfo/Idh/MocA family oxidoreductase [Synechocystis sp. LKSZ1]|uniref:Gfo/Idh/MocA family protein n=1 Tax=Synechocystis sp. LKSZ1 TaxID=3144951 RepID=UPI00336C2D5A
MSTPLGVAVVGTGFGKIIHIPAFQHHPGTELVAVYHRDLGTAKAIADQHQIPHAHNQLEKILRLPEVQAVSIATPPFLHYAMAKQVLAAGKHLLLEKPLTLRAEETRELYHLAQQNQVIAMADFEFRFIPAWQCLAQYLAQGAVGKLRFVKVDWLVGSRANPERPWNWYAQAEQGGGALGALGSHSFDYLHWLFGPAQELSARLSCAITERPDPLDNRQPKPVTADDTALISLTLAGGVPCQINLSSVTYAGRGHWLEVYGEKGTLVLGSDNLKDYVHGFRLWAAPAGKALTEVEIPKELAFSQVFTDGRLAPFLRVVDQWLAAITEGVSLAPSLREGTYSQLLMDLTHQAHQQKRWVAVPDLTAYLAQ